jgi:hypothetical protein
LPLPHPHCSARSDKEEPHISLHRTTLHSHANLSEISHQDLMSDLKRKKSQSSHVRQFSLQQNKELNMQISSVLAQHKHLPSYSQLDREQSISLESHWA